MRKSLVAALILAAVVMTMTSCSQDAAAGLGKVMKWMGGNVYGIKPDLRRPDAAIKTVDKISENKESLLNPLLAAELLESVAGFSGSSQSKDSFIANLDKQVSTPVSVFREAVEDLKTTTEDLNSNNAHVERLRTSFMEVVVSLENLSSEGSGTTVLTRRDIVTFSLMNSLVRKLSEAVESRIYEAEEMAIAENANEVLSVLKVSTSFSDLNVFGDIDVSGLLSAFSEDKSLDRASATNTIVLIFGKTLGKLASFTTEDNGFNLVKYNRLHTESKSIRFCYELSMIPYIKSSGEGTIISRVVDSDINYGLTLDDFAMYLASSFSRLMDSEEVSPLWKQFLGIYLNETNIAALCDMKNKVQDLQNPVDVMSDYGNFYESLALAIGLDGDEEEGKTPGQVLTSYIDIVYDFAKRAGTDEKTSFWDLVRALCETDEEEMPDEVAKVFVVTLFYEAIDSALGKFDEIKDNAIYFAGTSLGILTDAGFDSFFRGLF